MIAGFALAGFAVVIAPAVAMRWDLLNDGVGTVDNDLLATSTLVGAVQFAGTLRRPRPRQGSARRAPLLIASLNALVVLAVSSSLLLLAVLYSFPDEHASLGNRGWPVTLQWGVLQLAAVVLAEVTARSLLRWLDPAPPSPTPADPTPSNQPAPPDQP